MDHTHSPRMVTYKVVLTVNPEYENKPNQTSMLKIHQDSIKSTWGKRTMRQISVSGSPSEINQ